MTDLQLIIIALVQGITEFLPISSSGHLYLTSNLLGWPDQGVKVDAAVHVGTLAAVIIYCWREVGRIIGGFRTTGLRPRFAEQLEASGIMLPADIFEPGVEMLNQKNEETVS